MVSTSQTKPKADRSTKKQAERDALILKYLHLVRQTLNHVARRLPPHVDRDDLLEAGMVGLVDAAGRFDEDRNVQFSTYAITRIRGAMIDALRGEDWLPRSMRTEVTRMQRVRSRLEHEANGPVGAADISKELDLPTEKVNRLSRINTSDSFHSLSDMPPALIESKGSRVIATREIHTLPEERAMLGEQKELLAEALGDLPEKERLVISLYYFEQMNLREIADILEVTNSRICQIHRAALKRLQRLMSSADAFDLAMAI